MVRAIRTFLNPLDSMISPPISLNRFLDWGYGYGG